ncbi:MAG: DUF1538 domain-containing protein [Pseudomonadota bacterium]
MNVLYEKLKEVFYAVMPITIIVLILNFTITPIGSSLLGRFILGAIFVIIGLAIFLFGVDIGVTPIGTLMGSSLAKSNKIWIVGIGGLLLGFFVSIAEPDLHVLASQIDRVTSGLISRGSIVVVVSIGIAVMLTLGFFRIVYNKPLYKILTLLYFVIFMLSLFSSSEFLAISFDASGATTGALTVPFILALALGISSLKKDGKASEKDSFGLVAVASTGAILSVLIMSLVTKSDRITGSLGKSEILSDSIFAPFIKGISTYIPESFIALFPLLLMFLIFNRVSFKLKKKAYFKILKGLLYTLIGLTLFMTGVNASFMDVGTELGQNVASLESKSYLVITGFVLGLVTVLAEPAVYVLTHQIEDVTSGYVRRKIVLLALSIGVGIAVALSMIRIIIPEVKLWHYLLPGYAISILLAYVVPKLFVGIAFDSGGVASGPMTATFILAFANGAAEAIEGANVLVDGFGMISMVALMPIITLQILGLIFKLKSSKEGV